MFPSVLTSLWNRFSCLPLSFFNIITFQSSGLCLPEAKKLVQFVLWMGGGERKFHLDEEFAPFQSKCSDSELLWFPYPFPGFDLASWKDSFARSPLSTQSGTTQNSRNRLEKNRSKHYLIDRHQVATKDIGMFLGRHAVVSLNTGLLMTFRKGTCNWQAFQTLL